MKYNVAAIICSGLLQLVLQAALFTSTINGNAVHNNAAGYGHGNNGSGVVETAPVTQGSVNSAIKAAIQSSQVSNNEINPNEEIDDEQQVTEERKTFYHLAKAKRVEVVQQCMSRFTNATLRAMLELIEIADAHVVIAAQERIVAANVAIEEVQKAADELRVKGMATVRHFRAQKRDEWYEWESQQYERLYRIRDKRKRQLRAPISQLLSDYHKKLDACGDEIDDELHDLNLRIQAAVSALQPAVSDLQKFIEPHLKRVRGQRVALDADKANSLLNAIEKRTSVLPPLLDVVELRDSADFQVRSCYENLNKGMAAEQKKFEKTMEELIASDRGNN